MKRRDFLHLLLASGLGASARALAGDAPATGRKFILSAPQNLADVDGACGIAGQVGAKQILFWEADYIDDRANAEELKGAMRGRSDGIPH